MIKLLSAPYPHSSYVKKHWRNAFIMGLFVFLFLFGFQPFGLNEYPGELLALTFGYGMTCFISMVILNVVIPTLFVNFFSEQKWTVAKQIIWSLINVAFIGLANLLYSNFADIANFSIQNLVQFELYTIAIALFPLLLFILSNYQRLTYKFEKSATIINQSIKELQQNIKRNSDESIEIDSENLSESLRLNPTDLIYIQSADNYITVYFYQFGKLSSTVLRNTLKSLEEQLINYPYLFRCHKSYLVNLNKVERISGNAQGYKLHIEGLSELIPVSRSHNKTIKDKLTIRP